VFTSMHSYTYILLSFVAVLFSITVNASAIESDKAHQPFDAVLKAHVSDGHVNYAGIQQDSRFNDYIAYLEQAQPRQLATDTEQLAFWINAYNALSIKGIIDGKSPKTLVGRYKFFISTKYPLAGEMTSLNDLEKKIIIPYNESLIHFAIVCASASCPKLLSEAYTAENLQQQMIGNAKAFLNNAEKNQLDVNAKKIHLSKIFKWFKKEFSEKSGSVQQFIAPFIQDEALVSKLQNDGFKVKYLDYDWSLNGTPPIK